MENSNQQKEQLIDSLLVLYEKYKDDDYMSQKLSSYVSNQLPNIMINLKNQQLQRINCMEEIQIKGTVLHERVINLSADPDKNHI